MWLAYKYITTNLLGEVVVDGHVTITSLPNQWRIQRGAPALPLIFRPTWKIVLETACPHLAEGLDPPLQSHHKLPVFFSIGLHTTGKGVRGSVIILNEGFDLLIWWWIFLYIHVWSKHLILIRGYSKSCAPQFELNFWSVFIKHNFTTKC